MLRNRIVTVTMLVALVGLAAQAHAALLLDDPDALSGWQGSQTFYAADPTHLINPEVHYAVYAPGQYSGYDPSGGSQYVYAYQVFNTLNPAAAEISTFTVGLVPNAVVSHVAIDTTANAVGQSGGLSPFYYDRGPSSVRWLFYLDNIDYGQFGCTLLFTSPYGPQLINGSVIDGGLSNYQPMPSPVPEPMTGVLLALGGMMLAAPRLRRWIGRTV